MADTYRLLPLALAATLGAGPVAAQQALDAISVTATRNPIKAFEYPGMVSVIGKDEIDTLQPSSSADILRGVPNVEFTGGPRRSGEVPSIRGFSGPDVIVMFDGARQNYGSAHDGRFFLDPTALRQVEVLRGPASSLYGSGGTGGVIEFRTATAADLLAPGERFGGSVRAGVQTVNREKFGSFTAYAKPTEHLDLVGTVTKRDSGSIELGDDNELDKTDDDIVVGLFKAGLRLGEHHRIEGSFLGFRNDAQEPNNPQGAGSADEVDKEIRSDTFRLAYNYNNPANQWIDLDVVAYHVITEADELRLDNLGAGPVGELLRRDVDTSGFRIDNRSRFMLTDKIGAVLTIGGEAYEDDQDGEAGGLARDGVPDAEAETYGIYAQAEISWAEPLGVLPGDLLIIPGVRYDDYSASSTIAADNEDSQVSPRIGVSYLPTPWFLAFANYAHAFRAPTFDELYLTGTHFTIPLGPGATVVNRFVPNPGLEAQRTRTLEVGAGFTFNDVLRPRDLLQLKGSRFFVKGEDFIDLAVMQPALFIDCNPFIPGACDGTTALSNVPNARLQGNEIEFRYENDRFLASAAYSTLDGKNEDTGAHLGVLTPDQLFVHLALKLAEYDTVIGWRGEFAEEFQKVDTPADIRQSYQVHDFYIAWLPGMVPGLRLDLGIDNAFDADYTRVFTGAAEPGRNLKATVGYTMNW